MTIQSTKQHKQWLVLAALALTLAGVFVARPALELLSSFCFHEIRRV